VRSGGVVHIINNLGPGGAEMMLAKLVQETRNSTPTALVIGLAHDGVVGDRIRDLGVPAIALGLLNVRSVPRGSFRLAKLIRDARPDVVQTWLYHANVFGGLAARGAGSPPVAWGIHHADLSPGENKRSTRVVAKAGALLSKSLPAAIVVCADSARDMHQRLGYDDAKLVVIPNGFDIARFAPDPDAPRRLRERIGAPPAARLVGLVARFHPVKDHGAFIQAAAIAAQADPDLHFVLCGSEITWDNAELAGWIRATGFADRFHLLGQDDQPWTIQAGLDVACLSSTSEAFPLSIGEAMACGVPCAVTDVGDAALLVGRAGRLVPSRDPAALAAAIGELARLEPTERARIGAEARRKIETEFSLPAVAKRYESVWRRIASAPR
jgi:glycosyltransferase involved in cell wall biosynthesis